MTERGSVYSLVLGLGLALALASSGRPARAAGVPSDPPSRKMDFNRDVRPILSENCYFCHGPDKNKRKADLRLDTRDGLFAELKGEDGVVRRTVVPGKPQESELFARITSGDPDERMPDPKSNKSLSQAQVAVIKQWIEQGAEWKGHWAFLKPVKPQEPAAPDAAPAGFVRTAVDRFVLAKLTEQGLRPSPEADRVTLARRLYFDATGLPPAPDEVRAFVADPSPRAYEKVVDRLLASPHFGERMAVYWLDLVRFADTIGYHSDNPRDVAPYRDWVINAFNENKPFDQFTTEQLAGDLLPGATTQQKVASAYNRLLQTTEEGGAQPKEYRAKYAADRVRNFSTVWLAATMGCCECHDHKFDPFAARDFYSLAAFFADVKEADVGRREAGLPVPTPAQEAEVRKLDALIADDKKKLESPDADGLARLVAAQADWERNQAGEAQRESDWQVLDPQALKAANGTTLTRQPDGGVLAGGKVAAKETYTVTARTPLKGITAFRLEVLPDPAFKAGGPGTADNGNFVLTEFKVAVARGAKAGDKEAAKEASKSRSPVALRGATADFSQETFPVAHAIDAKNNTGWAVLPQTGKAHAAVFEAVAPVAGGEGDTTLVFTLDHQSQFAGHNVGKFRLSATTHPNPASIAPMPGDVKSLLAVPAERRDAKQKGELAAYYRTVAPLLAGARADLAGHEKAKEELLKALPRTLVTSADAPRVVRVLPRGNWLDETGEVVAPATPKVLPALKLDDAAPGGTKDGKERRATRLDLARWVVSPENPLTARVFVNRMWKLFYGDGLSRRLDDLGAQGEWPTNPDLLDWLAVDFMEHGWDVKRLVHLLVTSGAYRQSSAPGKEGKEKDPENRWLSRQARFRLDAEFVRDNALAVSGLLSPSIGGESVKPYQPAGYWDFLNFPRRNYEADHGDRQYRRGLYTWWQRTFLQPSLVAFDAPTREEAACERTRSNIPQQALVLLNDPTYVEAARVFAGHICREGGATVPEKLNWAFVRVLSRPPEPQETAVLTALFEKHQQEYAADRASAEKLVAAGEAPVQKDTDPAQLAAWTSVARTILNLHETITRN